MKIQICSDLNSIVMKLKARNDCFNCVSNVIILILNAG